MTASWDADRVAARMAAIVEMNRGSEGPHGIWADLTDLGRLHMATGAHVGGRAMCALERRGLVWRCVPAHTTRRRVIRWELTALGRELRAFSRSIRSNLRQHTPAEAEALARDLPGPRQAGRGLSPRGCV